MAFPCARLPGVAIHACTVQLLAQCCTHRPVGESCSGSVLEAEGQGMLGRCRLWNRLYKNGCALQGASWLLCVPGASGTVLEVVVPYSRGSLMALLGQVSTPHEPLCDVVIAPHSNSSAAAVQMPACHVLQAAVAARPCL